MEDAPIYPGCRSFSLATAGCNLHCRFCQNWHISQARSGTLPPSLFLPPEEVVAAAISQDCQSIAYTYTEPTVFIEYALDTARLARERGLSNVFVTNGYYTAEVLEEMGSVIDGASIDLKSFRDRYYRRVCGATLGPVLESIDRSVKKGMWIEVTTLVVPGLNDSTEELRDMARFLAGLSQDLPWHLSRFFPAYRLTGLAPTSLTTLKRAREIGKGEGLHHVYIGNVTEEEEVGTDCPQCGEVLLARTNLRFVSNQLRGGTCPRCGRSLAGRGLVAGRRAGVLH